MKKFELPVQSKPTEELIKRLSIMDTECLINEVLRYKTIREANGITVKDVCIRSRMTWVYKLEGLGMLPTVSTASRYIQTVIDCLATQEETNEKGL